MAKKDRTGKRIKRDERPQRRVPELGYYIIVTDAKGTEPRFFNGLRDNLPNEIRSRLVVKVFEADTKDLINKCLDLTAYEPQYRVPWIVFDRDRVVNYDKIIAEAEKKGIRVGWSNPCFEIWMFGYFKNIPSIQESTDCCAKFSDLFIKMTGQQYDKNDKDLYNRLIRFGDEDKAIQRASKLYNNKRKDYSVPSEMCPCTTVFELVDEIRKKTDKSV